MITYRAANSACEKGQQPERALDLLAEVQGLGLEPDVITYNAAISVREKGMQPERALELLTENSLASLPRLFPSLLRPLLSSRRGPPS